MKLLTEFKLQMVLDRLSEKRYNRTYLIALFLNMNKAIIHFNGKMIQNGHIPNHRICDINWSLDYLCKDNVGLLKKCYEVLDEGEEIPAQLEDGMLEEYEATGKLFSPNTGERVDAKKCLLVYYKPTIKLAGLTL